MTSSHSTNIIPVIQCTQTVNIFDWNICHTENHWSNEESVIRLVEKVLSPYIHETQETLDLALKHPALLTFDCFTAHYVDDFLGKLNKATSSACLYLRAAQGSYRPLI